VKRQDARGFLEPDEGLDRLASEVLGAAIEVHRHLGAGFLESVYERALAIELGLRGLSFRCQAPVIVDYKGHRVSEGYMDLLVADRLIVELKAVEALLPIHGVQLRSYLKASGLSLGLLISFNVPILLRGVRRVIQSS
jgi:GxxExxY protein